MKIDKYAPMVRQGSDINKITALLINGRLDGVNNGNIKKLPGYAIETENLTIGAGGTVVLGDLIFFKNKDDEVIILMMYNNHLYFKKTGNDWGKVDWDSEASLDLDEIKYWIDRGVMHITGGVDGKPAVYEYIDRQISEDNGYFNNSEEYNNFFWGAEELPSFDSDNIGYCFMVKSNVLVNNIGGGDIPDTLLHPTDAYYMMGQFVYHGGQVAIPISSGSVLRGITHDKECFMMTKIYIKKGTFDKRLEAADIYVAKISHEQGFHNPIEYPKAWGEGKSIPVRDLGEETFASRAWKFLQRVNIRKDATIWSGIGTFDVAGENAIVVKLPAVEAASDLTVNCFPQEYLGGDNFKLKYAPVDDPTNWTTVDIKANTLWGKHVIDGDGQFFIYIDETLVSDKKYYVKIISQWVLEEDPKAEGFIQIIEDADGEMVKIGSSFFIMNGVGIATQARDLAADINANPNYEAFVNENSSNEPSFNIFTVYVKMATGGASGNSCDLISNNPDKVVVSGDTLEGGKDGDYYSTVVQWRFDPELNVDVGDPIDVAQPYALMEEYHPSYRFAAHQNRRTYRLDCKLRKRHKNLLMWGEVDMPSVVPGLNGIFLNTFPDEESKGLISINNGLLALFERSGHLIRMTGEPIQYDAEESKFEVGCIGGIVSYEGIGFWLGFDGIYIFLNQYKNLIEDYFLDDYIALIANEYSNNSSSYDAIKGGYGSEDKLIVWTFPNSTYTIEGYAVKLLAWDLRKNEIIILESEKTFSSFAEGYNGKLFGIASDGIYKLFSSNPIESNRLVYRTGKMVYSKGRIVTKQLKIRYLGEMKITAINDLDNTVIDENFGSHSVMDFAIRDVVSEGEEVELEIKSNSKNTNTEKIGLIDFETEAIDE